ncbi:hypothetical protein HRbin02_00638 [Candidatus Calditenuaceae archaeon HR02]|nr:hypothetical protein HRbin02_00638 [Candidatus Calditenuaceae archaeon HR02]
MSRYLEKLPEMVRVKLGYAPDLTPILELSLEEVNGFGLLEAVEEAVKKGEERLDVLRRFGREFLSAVPEPVVALVPRGRIASFVRFLESRGVNPFNDPLILRLGEAVLTISIEFECG